MDSQNIDQNVNTTVEFEEEAQDNTKTDCDNCKILKKKLVSLQKKLSYLRKERKQFQARIEIVSLLLNIKHSQQHTLF